MSEELGGASSRQMQDKSMDDIIEEEGQVRNADSSQKADEAQANTVSVSQLQQMDRDPRFGAPPIYEQEARLAKDNNRQAYNGEDESVICPRFPHLDYCACDLDISDIMLIEVYNGIFMGPFHTAFKTGELIEAGVTHILNVTCKAYTKREKYFKYLDL